MSNPITRYWKIKELLSKVPVQNKTLAKSLGVSETFFSQVIKGKATSRRVAKHIETILGAEPGSLFPYVLEVPQRGPGSRPAVNE